MSAEKTSLLRKYNVPAPRYTSYPTVPYWESTPTEGEWLHHVSHSLTENAKTGTGAALYFHVPFCEKLCTFCGCNTRITKNHSVAGPYVETLLKEWELYQRHLENISPIKVDEIHLGGGTPTFLTPNELESLLKPVIASVQVGPEAEFSVEVDPRVTTEAHFAKLAELGFSRVSLGVQDFELSVQEVINRVQPYELVEKSVSTARKYGFSSINFDLIYGLPKQTLASIEETFSKVIQLRPERIAFYAYAHVPWIKPSHRRFTEQDLPDPQAKRALYELGRQMLEENGYHEVGMDHFALADDSLWKAANERTLHRNFMGYIAKHVSPLIGLGTSAISDSWFAFIQNEKIIEKYKQSIDQGRLPLLRGHILTKEDAILRQHILNLMTRFSTSWESPEASLPYLENVPEKLSEMVNDGLIELGDKSLRISNLGRAFIRNISMAFDARLSRKDPETRLFSTSI